MAEANVVMKRKINDERSSQPPMKKKRADRIAKAAEWVDSQNTALNDSKRETRETVDKLKTIDKLTKNMLTDELRAIDRFRKFREFERGTVFELENPSLITSKHGEMMLMEYRALDAKGKTSKGKLVIPDRMRNCEAPLKALSIAVYLGPGQTKDGQTYQKVVAAPGSPFLNVCAMKRAAGKLRRLSIESLESLLVPSDLSKFNEKEAFVVQLPYKIIAWGKGYKSLLVNVRRLATKGGGLEEIALRLPMRFQAELDAFDQTKAIAGVYRGAQPMPRKKGYFYFDCLFAELDKMKELMGGLVSDSKTYRSQKTKGSTADDESQTLEELPPSEADTEGYVSSSGDDTDISDDDCATVDSPSTSVLQGDVIPTTGARLVTE